MLPENFKELINFRVSMKQWSFCYHLCKYARYAPHVNRAGVAMGTEEDLRGSIPQGHHLEKVQKFTISQQ
jgi:hypothetical protein